MESKRAQLDQMMQDREKVVAIIRSYPIEYLIKRRMTNALLPKVDVDDIIQDIMLTVVRRVPPERVFRMHATGELRPWLATVIRNRVGGVVRKLGSRKRFNGHHTYSQGCQDKSGSFANLKHAVDRGRSPSSEEAAVEARDKLLSVIITLPLMYKRAISLCYLEENSPPEVARIMGHSLGVVRGLLHRGRGMIRARMGPADQWFSGADSEDRLGQVLFDFDPTEGMGDAK